MPLHVAIIGSGPSGFYTADSLLRASEDCRIDIVEALPTPYGLVRGGVAPDHQNTKRVSRLFAKIARNPRVTYFGNVSVGHAITLRELRQLYDAVVIAMGAGVDRSLEIPGCNKAGVHGSGAFVGWYNGHPDFRDLDPDLNSAKVAIIGNGNVALDIARVLVKTEAEMAESDLAAHAAAAIHQAPIEDVYIIGRRGPTDTKFTNKELSEVGDLVESAPTVDPTQLPRTVTGEMSDHQRSLREKNLATFRAFAARKIGNERKRLNFLFYAQPVEVMGGGRVEGMRFERTRIEAGRAVGTGETFDIPCRLVVSAIGYSVRPLAGVPIEEISGVVANRAGRVERGLYAVGWAKRGPSGVIGTNKADGDAAAHQILEEVTANGRAGGAGLRGLLDQRSLRWVSFNEWQQIDRAEIAAAPGEAPRQKFARVQDMLDVIGRQGEERPSATD